MRAPREAYARATARPTPADAPVIITTGAVMENCGVQPYCRTRTAVVFRCHVEAWLLTQGRRTCLAKILLDARHV
jgi:hypothetical protein